MNGNTWQMVWDAIGEYPTGEAVDPTGPEQVTPETKRVWRGGSWYATYANARSAFRYLAPPDGYFGDAGFRIARTLNTDDTQKLLQVNVTHK
jgi:formylglycine-generating enzyme required for sulfatase activity